MKFSDSTQTVPHQGNNNLPWPDGVRESAAFWVFVSHVLILCGARWISAFSEGGAVDLFMLLSGSMPFRVELDF